MKVDRRGFHTVVIECGLKCEDWPKDARQYSIKLVGIAGSIPASICESTFNWVCTSNLCYACPNVTSVKLPKGVGINLMLG